MGKENQTKPTKPMQNGRYRLIYNNNNNNCFNKNIVSPLPCSLLCSLPALLSGYSNFLTFPGVIQRRPGMMFVPDASVLSSNCLICMKTEYVIAKGKGVYGVEWVVPKSSLSKEFTFSSGEWPAVLSFWTSGTQEICLVGNGKFWTASKQLGLKGDSSHLSES